MAGGWWLVGQEPGDLVAPTRWSPDASAAMELIPPEDVRRYTAWTPEGPLVTLIDSESGAETYVGRALPHVTDS